MPVKKNLNSFIWNANKRAIRYNRAARTGALLFERQVKLKIITSRPSGRLYRRFGKIHIASAPGEPPAIDTGRLVNSLSLFKVNTGHFRVGTAVIYAARLDNPRKLNRPFFASTFQEHRDTILAEMRQELTRR